MKTFLSAISGEPLVLVYQMGKVGSISVAEALRSRGFLALHVHFMTPEGIERDLKRRSRGWAQSPATRVRDLTNAWEAWCLHELVEQAGDHKWKVVTLIRDPLARSVSSFFHSIDEWISDFGALWKSNLITPQDVAGGFVDQVQKSGRDMLFDTWFDSELRPMFGIDVLSEDFDRSKGYKIYEGERAQVLLLKLEALDDCAADAFKEFLGVDRIAIGRANVGAQRKYGDFYQRFKEVLVIPKDFANGIYQSDCIRWFYSEEEIARFMARWTDGRK